MKLRIGIVGVGSLGSVHLKILRRLKDIKKIYLVDIDKEKLSLYKEESYSDFRDIKGKVDLAIIATPTPTHFQIAKFFLENRIPILVEKPLTDKLNDARKLINLSRRWQTLLFVGHVERYNNAYLSAKNLIKRPKFIECHRLSPYPWRSLDVSVVLDLMIHDLDIILDIVKDKIKKIEAVGVKVLSKYGDIANVRITFTKGCIANITASRVSKEKMRKFRVFSPHSYVSLDYANQKVEIYQKRNDTIYREVLRVPKEEPLKKELQDFINWIKNNKFSLAPGRKAERALELALKIQKKIESGR
jgi:predicted dehydrogenase